MVVGWASAQDQARIIKQRLVEMIPEMLVFLDVDDMKEGRGAEYLDVSKTFLIFVSSGYFESCVSAAQLEPLTLGPRLDILVSVAGRTVCASCSVPSTIRSR